MLQKAIASTIEIGTLFATLSNAGRVVRLPLPALALGGSDSFHAVKHSIPHGLVYGGREIRRQCRLDCRQRRWHTVGDII